MASTAPFTHLSGATTTVTGAVADFQMGRSSITVQVVASTGTTAGAVSIFGSVDGVNFTPLSGGVTGGKSPAGVAIAAGVVTFTAPSSILVGIANAGGALRYIRADVTTNMVGGTVSAFSIAGP